MEKTETAKAYAFCRELSRREGSNFYWGFRFLSRAEHDAMCALYAFARRSDDIVDDETVPVAARRESIENWDRSSARAFEGMSTSDPILTALADTTRRYGIPSNELRLLIEGCRDDLSIRRYPDLAGTLGYCRKVAVTVGMAMLAIFRAHGEEERRAMTSLGYAFQLTNILRDVPEDLRRDRVYLPEDELRRAGVTEDDLRIGPTGGNTAALEELLGSIGSRNRLYYDEAEPLFRLLATPHARAMRTMARIYGALLDQMRSRRFDVWNSRPRLSAGRKAAIVARTAIGL